MAASTPTLSIFKPTSQAQVANKNGPDHKFQINQDLLYERTLPGDAFVSAHLQRLQNGIFSDKNIHDEYTRHVTFAAITFTIHPCNSIDHRVKHAVIHLKASNLDGTPLRFLKFAPHQAFGRISQASLKWNFQLGATLGVTKGPVNLSATPSVSYEKDTIVGTMMRIQGSTRCLPAAKCAPRMPDTLLIWSLEENSQQQGGVPHEFTFVFLVERPNPLETPHNDKHDLVSNSFQEKIDEAREATKCPSKHLEEPDTSKQEPSPNPNDNSKDKPEDKTHKKAGRYVPGLFHRSSASNISEPIFSFSGDINKVDRVWRSSAGSAEERAIDGLGRDIHHAKEIATEVVNDIREGIQRPFRSETLKYSEESEETDMAPAHHAAFMPIRFSICVEAHVEGVVQKFSVSNALAPDFDNSIVKGEVGQKLPTDMASEEEREAIVNGLYNFAKLPGSIEDMVELPGSSTTTMEPTLSDPR